MQIFRGNLALLHVILLRDNVATKLAKLERLFEQIHNAHIVLNVENPLHIAKTKLHIVGSVSYATTQHDDMYAAINALANKKLDRSAFQHQNKLTNY